MKPGIPWSVKGIEPEVREAAKHAARRSGMTLGEWLNSVILDQAEDGEAPQSLPEAVSAKDFSEPRRTPPAPRGGDDTTIRLEDIAEQLSRLARREQESAAIMPYEAPAARSRDSETLNRILTRVDGNERQTVEAFTAVNERLSVLGRQIAQSVRPKPLEKPEDVPGFPALESAIRNVVDHIEVSEKRTRETLKSMQDRMGEMTQRATAASSDEVLQAAPAFVSLETRLNELAQRVHRSEAQVQSGLPELVRQEVSHLADRIEQVREASETLAHQAQSAAVGTAQKDLRDIEARIVRLLKEAQATLGSQSASASDLQRLRGEIGTLNQRIDESRAATASERDVHALRVAVEQLSTRVAQGPDMRPLADMDRRLADVTTRLEQAQNANRGLPQLGELDRRIGELDQRLEEALRRQGDSPAIAALEQQIAAVNDRLGRTEQQLTHFDTIERAISQLFESLEQSRTLARDAAEDAASRAADRILQAQPPQPPAGPSPELRALEDGLRAVRESAVSSDQRSQETLEAVHETLEQIVAKLAELETSAAGHQLAVKMAQQSAVHVETSAAAPAWQSAATQPQAQPFFDPTSAFQDQLFEPEPIPASAAPRVEQPAAQPMAPAVDFSLGDPSKLAVGDDFIAAARRAAQAASSKPSVLTAGVKPELQNAADSRFKLSLSFLKPKSKPQPMTFTGGKLVTGDEPKERPKSKPRVSNDNRRRKLLLAGLLLLAAVGAFTFNMVMKSPKPVKETSAIESTMDPAQVSQIPQTKPVSTEKVGLILPEASGDGSVLTAAPATDTAAAAPLFSDGILTGALPAKKTEASLASIVAQPGSSAEKADVPPPEVGSQSLRDAAAAGDATAQFIVASRYLDGQNVTQDFTRAAYWYQQAAAHGLAPAQYRIATLFERGRGVPQDVATALLWYERAATGGNVKSMHNAAVISASTQLGTPNYDKAFRWFSEAAKRGLKDSQFNLAVLFERGLGTRVDTGEALSWYMLAARQGDADAGTRAAQLTKTLPAGVVTAARQRFAQWTPLPTVDDANVVAIADQDWKAPGDATVQQAAVTDAGPAAAPAADPVMTAQQLLTRLGFNVGQPDGKMGARTANAIRLFQLQSGMKVTGEATADVLAAMQAKAG